MPNLLRSLVRSGSFRPSVLVVDTSRGLECGRELRDFRIPLLASPGTCHGEAVNLGLGRVQTPHVLLVDSDVLFLRDVAPLLETFVRGDFTLTGERIGDAGGKSLYPRIVPWFCLLHRDRLARAGFLSLTPEKSPQTRDRRPCLRHRIHSVGGGGNRRSFGSGRKAPGRSLLSPLRRHVLAGAKV